ncbi:hypothetical protein NN561_020309 [Cricetulus griseus]
MGLRRWLRSACCCCPCRCLEEPARPEKEPLVRCVPARARASRGGVPGCPLNREGGTVRSHRGAIRAPWPHHDTSPLRCF